MIDPKELRIGNLVSDRGIPGEITQTDFADKPLMRRIEPIPLTPEWLERFGLYKPYDQFYWTFNDRKLSKIRVHFKEGGEEWFVYFHGAYIAYRKHVHEFQNLMKELTGQELKTTE